MKNPIKQIKHMVKDPINTVADCEARKKEVMPWFIVTLAIAVITSVLGGAVSALGFLTVVGVVFIFATMFFGFLLFIISKAKAKFLALTCNDCGVMAEIKTREDFEKYVEYTVEPFYAEYKGLSHPASNNGVIANVDAKAEAHAVVKIKLTCPNCGKVKELIYKVKPFSCIASESKVPVRDIELVKMRLENAVKAVVADYNDPEIQVRIPYSIHSKKHPRYEERTKPQTGNSDAFPAYNGVRIKYRKDVEEMVEVFFLENQLDGTIVDPTKTKK